MEATGRCRGSERHRGEAGRRLPAVAPAPHGAAQLLPEAGIRGWRRGRKPYPYLALSAPPDPYSERHPRPRIPETADAFDQPNRGTQVGRSESAARRTGGPRGGQIDDRGLEHARTRADKAKPARARARGGWARARPRWARTGSPRPPRSAGRRPAVP